MQPFFFSRPLKDIRSLNLWIMLPPTEGLDTDKQKKCSLSQSITRSITSSPQFFASVLGGSASFHTLCCIKYFFHFSTNFFFSTLLLEVLPPNFSYPTWLSSAWLLDHNVYRAHWTVCCGASLEMTFRYWVPCGVFSRLGKLKKNCSLLT